MHNKEFRGLNCINPISWLLRVDHEIFIAPASDFARTKYTPSQRPLHHFCCERARAQHYDSLTQWTLCARPLAHQMQLLRKYTLLHAGAATRRYTPEKLLLSSLLLLAGAINHFFMVYPQKYKNCSTLIHHAPCPPSTIRAMIKWSFY
jgi:hypothetical protein